MRTERAVLWQDPFMPLRFPKLFNLRSDPFETADQRKHRLWTLAG